MSPMRVGGLASGMDIDQLVGDLMKAERMPLDKLFQKKTTMEWQRDAYREVNTKLQSLDDYLFNNFVLSSNFNKKTTVSTNSSYVDVTSSSTQNGTFSIDKVTQLATKANSVGNAIAGDISNEKISNLTGTSGTQTIRLSVLENGAMKEKSFSFDGDNTTVSQLISKVNNADLGVTLFYDAGAGKMSLQAKNSGGDGDAATAEVKIGLSDPANAASGTDSFSSNLFAQFGFSSTDLASNGQNAKLTVNGLDIERASNTMSLNGVSFTIKNTFNVIGSPSISPVSVTATADIDSMVNKIKEFVSKYNELVTGMNDKLKEKSYRDFPPLTDEQRKDMSEKEQELWDEKAKSGMLRNDDLVRSGMSNIRNVIGSRTSGIGDGIIDTLAEMGITTSKNFNDGGQLVIDETKLRKALTENPDQVVQTFSRIGEVSKDANGAIISDTRGLAQKLRDSLKGFVGTIEKRAGKSTLTDAQYDIGKRLTDANNRIARFQDRLKDVEARYWKQFTAMEQAIQKANQQSAFLMGQTGSM